MNHPLYLNLPVADVQRSRHFVEALGLCVEPQFSGEHATCVRLNDGVLLMLLARPMFASFTTKPVGDPLTSTQHFITLSFDSRAAVDEFHRRAIDAGALMEHDAEDSGDMYPRGFNDPDGHQWGLFGAAPASTPPAP